MQYSPHLERSDTRVTSLTLPGLDAVDTDRSAVTFDAHVRAVVDAVSDSDERTVLVVHSGAGPVGYAVTDRIPDRVARIVYVDSGPMPDGAALRPDLASDVIEIPLAHVGRARSGRQQPRRTRRESSGDVPRQRGPRTGWARA